MIVNWKTVRAKFLVFAALALIVTTIVDAATAYGRAWSIRAYEPELRQTIRAYVARDEFGKLERVALSVLAVTPEYAPVLLDETALYLNVLPELSKTFDRLEHFKKLRSHGIAPTCPRHRARARASSSYSLIEFRSPITNDEHEHE